MMLVHNRCEFADRQIVRLQETPDSVPDGQTPHTVSLGLYDELVDTVKPGDRVTVTGIFRSVPVRLNPRQRIIKSLFKTYVDVLHVKKTDKRRMGVDGSTRSADDRRGVVGVGMEEEADGPGLMNGDDDDDLYGDNDAANEAERQASAHAKLKERLVEISRRPDIYEYLARSLAPSIYEMDDVKKGILLQLFGGTNKSIAKGGGAGGPRYRGDINVLLVGDPGTSKSQILQVRFASLDLLRVTMLTSSPRPAVRPQDCASRSLHVGQRFLRRRSDGLRHSRSRFEAARAREVRSEPSQRWWNIY